MPVNKPLTTPAIAIDTAESIQIDCYVRSTVPAPLIKTINTIIDRLLYLCENGSIADCHVTCWPPETVNTNVPTRDELIAQFESWAEQHECSLKPAFHRKQITPSLPGLNDPCERVRVPVVALALYEADTDGEADSKTLQGVIPYTEETSEGGKRTHTVEELLSTVERAEDGNKAHDCQDEQWSLVEGEQ
ncbi:hypothetical protein CP556_24465 [Natrinema sp. CBA1119]|uniref:HTH domain-containing protein n=1 Tax=Natrinema sp. CBA1119 TaxID=1608465 RepID=UPI000BF69A98|nr:HTH domain-containing protein [Natrinema sp. CBA1119]PGF14179.1 hypothetical protein CP556_24465 [Natrinema sp. CBA1119]